MKFECTFCDVIAPNADDPIFEDCKKNRHEILPMIDGTEESTKEEKTPKKPKVTSKVKGFVDRIYVESILVDGKPHFLARRLDTNDILVKDSLMQDGIKIKPLTADECGYYPYKFTAADVIRLTSASIKLEDLLDELKQITDRYIVAKELDKWLVIGDIVITYCQEWISTVHFPFFVGETESGKSSVLHLGRQLCYRCLYGEDLPNADVYNFLGSDEEGTGTIAEDEAQELSKDREKIRTYKNSYSKGSNKARMLMLSNKKQQKFYKTFCPKWFAGEKIPQDKGFMERLAVIFMSEGEPRSNIKRVTDAEASELNELRNKLLIWKLQNIGKEVVRVDCGLKGRDQELWADFISVFHGTKYFEKCKNVVTFYVEQRQQSIHQSLEAKIFRLVLDKLNSDFQLNFVSLWDYIITENPILSGTVNEKTRKTFYPDDYPNQITHNSLAKIIEYKYQGIKVLKKYRDQSGIQHQTTMYSFNKDTINRLARKYGIQIPLDSPLYTCSSGERCQLGDQDDHVDDLKGESKQ
jgi:hypothetical protein